MAVTWTWNTKDGKSGWWTKPAQKRVKLERKGAKYVVCPACGVGWKFLNDKDKCCKECGQKWKIKGDEDWAIGTSTRRMMGTSTWKTAWARRLAVWPPPKIQPPRSVL